MLAEILQVGGQVLRRSEGVRVVLENDAAASGQGVLIEVPGGMMLAEIPHVGCQVAERLY
jgi:hypothetical protein